jgi:hypothetical protein
MSLCFQNPDVLRRTSGQSQNTTPVMQVLNVILQWLFRGSSLILAHRLATMAEIYHGFHHITQKSSMAI